LEIGGARRIPARWTGTDPVGECDAGVSERPTPMSMRMKARASDPYPDVAVHSASITTKEASRKT
jgi:hypothetical protein